MDTCTEVKPLLEKYMSALAFHEDIEIVDSLIYQGPNQEKLDPHYINIPSRGIVLYPSYTEQQTVFGKRLKFAWTVDKIVGRYREGEMDADPVTVLETPNAGEACIAIVRHIFEQNITKIQDDLATDAMAEEMKATF